MMMIGSFTCRVSVSEAAYVCAKLPLNAQAIAVPSRSTSIAEMNTVS